MHEMKKKKKINNNNIIIIILISTPAGFEPARAEPNSLAGCRLNHSAKVSYYIIVIIDIIIIFIIILLLSSWINICIISNVDEKAFIYMHEKYHMIIMNQKLLYEKNIIYNNINII